MSYTIALAGNPNCGKTTMFNALTGANQYVGNWPGVTVEKKEGKLKTKEHGKVNVVDLPGIYSLSPYTLEEVVSRDYLLESRPDAIINLVDATNIERNLYLTSQILELGIPTVIALNMSDLLSKDGIKIDVKELSKELGCPVIETSALKGKGLKEAVHAAIEAANNLKPRHLGSFDDAIESSINEVLNMLPESIPESEKRWYAIKLLEHDSKVIEKIGLDADKAKLIAELSAKLTKAYDDDVESIITDNRYRQIQAIVTSCVKKPKKHLTLSDKLDMFFTNRILGLPIFIAVMTLVYYVSVTTVGDFLTTWTNDTFVAGAQDLVRDWLENLGTNDLLVNLVVDGIMGGVGNVLGFLPQMAVLFLFLSVLEDCGYMVRIAFVMDRIFRHFGLSGKSFIPLLISSGCGVPGIMASKTIENDSDRRLTIMTATFIPCGAKLPVIALMGGVMSSYITGEYTASAYLATAMYFTGVLAVLVSAIVLKKTSGFAGDPVPFVMELPRYHVPTVKTVLIHIWERLRGFIVKAGTILFLASLVMWFLGAFGFVEGHFATVEDSQDSLMSDIGGFIAPIFMPLGFDTWQPVAASISGFTAKEAIVSTMGVLANVADNEDPQSVAEATATWFTSIFAALSFLVFNLLDSPCLAAIAAMARQMQSRKWFWFALIYQNLFAYCVAMCVYQFGMWYMTGAFGLWTGIASVVFVAFLYMLFRKDPNKNKRIASVSSIDAVK